MSRASSIVSSKFNSVHQFASNAASRASQYMSQIQSLLGEIELPELEGEEPESPEIPAIDYSTMPSFTQELANFPSFNSWLPVHPILADIPDVDIYMPAENFHFHEQIYSPPTINLAPPPQNNINLQSVEIPAKPNLEMPDVPTLTDIEMPDAPNIDLPDFNAVSPTVDDISPPAEINYQERPYNSDIRVALFGKILEDLRNGGTGLDIEVEQELYDRGRERQRVENERLYREVEDQFSAAGFSLPSGAYASRMLEVSNEISRKNDQLSREITISQADLAQKNTQFTVEQARQIESMLMDFFNQQENRSLEAARATAQNAVEIFNSLVSKQRLKLEKYQTEASVFEQQIRAELSAIEIYRAKVESARAKAEVQQSRVNVYKSQLEGLGTLMRLYATEMESARIQADVEKSKIEEFRAQTETYVAQTSAEKIKADIYNSQVESERSRSAIYSEKVKAYQSKVEAKRSEVEAQRINAENTLKENQLRIDEYRAKLDRYRAELETEIKNAQLQVEGFKTEASAYEAQTNAKGMEYQTRIQEIQAQIEKAKNQAYKQVNKIDAIQNGYVSLKNLQSKGLEGVMNANAQLAASAMNAVNASASLSDRSTESESERYSEIHSYDHD